MTDGLGDVCSSWMSVFTQDEHFSMMGTRTVHMRGRQQGESRQSCPLIDRQVADDARFWILRSMGPRLHLVSEQRNGQALQSCLTVGRSSVIDHTHAERTSEAEARIRIVGSDCQPPPEQNSSICQHLDPVTQRDGPLSSYLGEGQLRCQFLVTSVS